MNLLPKWALVNTFPAIHDFESMTVIEQTARIYGAMQSLINEYNAFAEETNKHLESFTDEETEAREEFEHSITKVMNEFICRMEQYLQLNLGETAETILEEGLRTGKFSLATDTTLSASGVPADAKATGARISNLAKLREGSTTGDAELQDIRVGYDGTNYSTAGDAVRGQVSAARNDALTAGGSLAGSSGQTGTAYPDFPYTDCNDFPANTVFGVNNSQSWLANMPYDGFVGQIFTTHFGKGSHNTGSGRLQIAVSMTGTKKIAVRNDFGNKNNFTPWEIVGCSETYYLKSTNLQIVSADQGYASYNDLPANTIVMVTAGILADEPYKNAQGVVITSNYTPIVKGGAFQLFIGTKNRFCFRMGWNSPIEWQRWEQLNHSSFENPKLITSFGKIGTIGDSLCAGASSYTDVQGNTQMTMAHYTHAWPAFMGKHFSVDVVNCSRAGATTRSWFVSPHKEHCYDKAVAAGNECNAYIIGLGRNDKNQIGESYLGSVADIDVSNPANNKDSYYGNYAKIISTLKGIRPKAKFFLLKDPLRDDSEQFNAAIDDIASMFTNCYVISLKPYYHLYVNDGFYKQNERNTHYNSAAYNMMGQMIGNEISRFMYENPEEFLQMEFIDIDTIKE